MLPVIAAGIGLAYLISAAREDAEVEEKETRRQEKGRDDLLDECYLLKEKCIKVQDSDGKELFRGKVLSVDFRQEVVVLELIVMGNRGSGGPKKMKVWSPRRGETMVRC